MKACVYKSKEQDPYIHQMHISYISLHDTVSSAILLTEDELVTTKWENRFMKFITYGWQATSWVDDGLGI